MRLYPDDPTRVLSDDPYAVQAWHDEPLADGGGYWWPERIAVPPLVRVESLLLPFLPYAPLGGLRPQVPWVVLDGVSRCAVKRPTAHNRLVVAGPGPDNLCVWGSFAPTEWVSLQPVLRRNPRDDTTMTWSWDGVRMYAYAKQGPARVSLWLRPGREEEFAAAVAAERLRTSR